MRSDAALLIVFVSDGDDCTECDPIDEIPPVSEYVESFRSIKGDRDQIQVSVIAGLEDNTCDEALLARRYIEAASKTGGSARDICTSDWSDMLGDLGLASTGVRTSFQTSFAADVETLEVFVDDEKVREHETDGWTYDPDTWYITFGANAIPERGSEINAVYNILPGGYDGQDRRW